MYTDPIADMLTRIRNAYLARRVEVRMPHSKIKEAVAEVLDRYEFIDGILIEGEGKDKTLTVGLRYDNNGKPVVEGIKRISKPGLRRYDRVKDLSRVRGGFGISIISTSHGVMSGAEAREKKLGGEVIAYIW